MSKNVNGQRGAVRPYRKAAFGVLILLLLAVGIGGYYWWNANHKKPQYVTGDVTMGDVERSVNVTGSINPRVTVQVGSYVSGTVKSLSCDFNSEVKAGQICAKIDPSTFQVAVDQASAQVNSSRAQLKKDEAALVYAKAVFDRDTKLLKDGIVAAEIVDNDKSVFKQANAQIDLDKASIIAQEASLKSAVVNLGYTNIVSPVTGTVLTRNVDVGQTVASSLQTPTLFLIGKDMTKMQVDANVSEADVGRIKVGQDVTFSVQAYPDKEFDGVVKQIRRGPITVQNVVTYDVVVAVDNPELVLFPGMTADAEIVTDSRENVLRVPLAATRYNPEHAGHGGEGAHGATTNNNRDRAESKHSSDRDSKANKVDEKTEAPAAKAADKAAASTTSESSAPTPAVAENDQRGSGQWQHRGDHPRDGSGEHRGWNRDHAGRGDRGGEHHGGRHREDGDVATSDKQDKIADKAVDDSKSDTAAESKTQDDSKSDKQDSSKPVVQEIGTKTASAAKTEAPRKRARVWVLRNGVVRPVSITIGLDDGDVVEVLDGDLKPGDKVIVNEVKPIETTKPTSVQSPFAAAGGGGRRGPGR